MTTPIVVVGAGGHAAVIIELLRAEGVYSPVAALDPTPEMPDVLGVPVGGGDDTMVTLFEQGVRAAVIAIGSNRLRQTLGEKARALGFKLPTVVHPTALVSPSAILGDGIVIMAGAHVGARARIGDFAVVNTAAIVEHDDVVGLAAHVAPGVSLGGCVYVGDRALVGIGSAVRPGSRIGDNVVIGAGSSVVGDIESGATVAGAPARPLRNGAAGA